MWRKHYPNRWENLINTTQKCGVFLATSWSVHQSALLSTSALPSSSMRLVKFVRLDPRRIWLRQCLLAQPQLKSMLAKIMLGLVGNYDKIIYCKIFIVSRMPFSDTKIHLNIKLIGYLLSFISLKVVC